MAHLNETPFTVICVKTVNDTQSGMDVVEVACVKISHLKVTDHFHALVQPETPLPEEFTRKTGIYSAHLQEKPSLDAILPELAAFVDRDVIVWTGHPQRTNAVRKYFRLNQIRGKELFLQTLAQQAWPDLKRHGVANLAAFLQLETDGLVRAESIAETAAGIFIHLLRHFQETRDIHTMLELLAFVPARPSKRRATRRDLPFDWKRLKDYPTLPGVYFMKNGLGEILYIGKAKNLRNRLRSYFQKQSALAPKIAAMMQQVTTIDVTTVGSELEALLLEARLIKTHQPYFNKKVKDFRRMVFLKVSVQEAYPRISIAVDAHEPNATYFGPFTGKTGLEDKMETLNRVFKLRGCTDAEFSAHQQSPCLQYHLGLCSGPCAGLISEEDYRESVDDFIRYLEQKPSHTVEGLIAKRDAYIETLMFEKAAQVQERLESLEQMQLRNDGLMRAVEEHHCLFVLPDVESDSFRILSVLQGQPFEWHSFSPHSGHQAELMQLVGTVFESMRIMEDSASRANIPKAMFEEARLLSQWLKTRDEDEGQVIYLKGKSIGPVFSELTQYLFDQFPMLTDAEWEREISAEL